MEAPPAAQEPERSPTRAYDRIFINSLKAQLSRLDVSGDLKKREVVCSNPNAIVFTLDGNQSHEPEYHWSTGYQSCDSVLCIPTQAGQKEIEISSAAQHERPILVSPSANSVTFLVNQEPAEKSHGNDSCKIIKTVSLSDGSTKSISLTKEHKVPLIFSKILYDEKNNCYYLAGSFMGCWGDSSYLYKITSSGEISQIFKNSNPSVAVESMHLHADDSLLTTHGNGQVCRWDMQKAPAEKTVLLDFDLRGMELGVPSTASDLSADQKTFFVAYNKSCNDSRHSLLSHIYCHKFENPLKRKEIFDPSDHAIITKLKAVGNSQIVCARLHRPDIDVKTDADRRQFYKGPFKSSVQVWDVDAGTQLLQFTIDEKCKALTALDDGNRLCVSANNYAYEGGSYQKLQNKMIPKLEAISDMARKKREACAGKLSDADKREFLALAMDDSDGKEYLVDGVPMFFNWIQIRNHEHDDPLLRKFHAGFKPINYEEFKNGNLAREAKKN